MRNTFHVTPKAFWKNVGSSATGTSARRTAVGLSSVSTIRISFVSFMLPASAAGPRLDRAEGPTAAPHVLRKGSGRHTCSGIMGLTEAFP
ncbi:MAG TPA: hypothetical protein VFP73_08490 [Terrabacter sp.]|nr:hypothetical protein [Terrabacter sp.]